MKSLLSKSKQAYLNMRKVPASSHSIALGFAMGTFFCILPTPGLSILIALGIATFFKSINRIALLSSFAIWNPLLTVPLNTFIAGILGRFFTLEGFVAFDYGLPVLRKILSASVGVFLSNALVSVVMASMLYGILRILIAQYQRKRRIGPQT